MGFTAPTAGVAGPTAAEIGAAVGAAVPVPPSAAAIGAAVGATPSQATMYGNGADGAVTLSGNTTLTRDMKYTTLTINAGVTLITAGFRVQCSVSLTNNGTISNDGFNGTNTTTGQGAGGLQGTLTGGSRAGLLTTTAGSTVVNGLDAAPALYTGGDGGDSSTASSSYISGVGGKGGSRIGFSSVSAGPVSGATLSGGAGAGSMYNNPFFSGGGGGGGVVFLAALTLTNNGTIHANGGTGYGDAYGAAGGGGGGVTVLVSATRAGAAATANGGAPGSGPAGATYGAKGQCLEVTL